MTPAERAVKILREAADALEVIPPRDNGFSILAITPISLRNEATKIERISDKWTNALSEEKAE